MLTPSRSVILAAGSSSVSDHYDHMPAEPKVPGVLRQPLLIACWCLNRCSFDVGTRSVMAVTASVCVMDLVLGEVILTHGLALQTLILCFR